MSGKEAKLAAARKRAEELKAKKAKKDLEDQSKDQEDASHENNDTYEENSIADRDNNSEAPVSSEEAVDSQGAEKFAALTLQFNKEEQANKELSEQLRAQEASFSDAKARYESRIKELEALLTKKDEQIEELDLELNKLRKKTEDSEGRIEEMERKLEEATDQEKNRNQVKDNDLFEKSTALEREFQKSEAAREALVSRLEASENDHQAARLAHERVEGMLVELQQKHASLLTSSESSMSRATTLQSENTALLTQLTELRERLISIQDEKLALTEAVDRLSKATKPKSPFGTTPRLSFDRNVSLQDVSLLSPNKSGYAVEELGKDGIPKGLESNIKIDLTEFYRTMGGVMFEV